jgi:voltage-gated potassium channel
MALAVNTTIMVLIVVNVLAIIFETVKSLSAVYQPIFDLIEIVSVIVFTIEYVVRLWVCTKNPQYNSAIGGRARFAVTPMMIVDLLAILPFYLPMLFAVDLRFLRALRLFRLVRIFKISKYTETLVLFGRVLHTKKEMLVMTTSAIVILLILASSIVYYFEFKAQPEAFSSIPATMWWGIATLTTVGYGDIYPITVYGRIFGSLTALLGIGLFALPAGIIASGFIEEIQARSKKDETCPHCGKKLR